MMHLLGADDVHKVALAVGSDADFYAVKKQVETGKAALVKCFDCYFVLRQDHDGLCVVAAQGRGLEKSAPYIAAVGRKVNAPLIIFHTKRKAITRVLRDYGFVSGEVLENGYQVFRIVLNG